MKPMPSPSHQLVIMFKNGQSLAFQEKHIDCTEHTIKGHSHLLGVALRDFHSTGRTMAMNPVYQIDRYTLVLLGEIIAAYVEEKL